MNAPLPLSVTRETADATYERVAEIGNEPDYAAATAVLK